MTPDERKQLSEDGQIIYALTAQNEGLRNEREALRNELKKQEIAHEKWGLELIAERDALRKLCWSAGHALRSYEYGNVAPDLAKEVADAIERQLTTPRLLSPDSR